MKTVDFKDIVIFENKNYLLVNKPAYLSALDDRNAVSLSLKNWARQYTPEASLCHRLDKETSGALAIAKNPDAYRNLAIQFENREVKKVYHALSEGLHDFGALEINLPIHKLSNGLVKVDRGRGKDALTFVNTIQAFRKHTLLECLPVTGRLHQIRVHLSSVHAPIAGDETYGGHALYLSELKRHFNLKKGTEEQPLMKRVALHAHSLTFKDIDGRMISVVAPYPKDFTVLVKQLGKFSVSY